VTAVATGETRAPSLRRILAATDFSAGAGRALAYAETVARRLGAELVLVHVSEALAVVPGSDLAERQRIAAREQLDAQVDELAGRGLAARAVLRAGLPFDEIVAAADAEGADLIVMGTHGRSGLSHLLMGSVAERVVRQASCPVLTVPYRAKRGTPPG
jgi:universal stress protein A